MLRRCIVLSQKEVNRVEDGEDSKDRKPTPVTTVTERIVVKNVEDNPKQLASLGIANAYGNAHNIEKLIKTLKQFKGKMAEMKEAMRKEERVYIESKRKYEATLSNHENIQ